MILVFKKKQSNAFTYICKVLFSDFEDGHRITQDPDEFKLYPGPKICYDAELVDENAISFKPEYDIWSGIGLRTPPTRFSVRNDLPILFPCNGDMGFDVFSASFFVISRYEEYLNFKPDRFGRFTSRNASETGRYYKRPVVDLWTKELTGLILSKWPHEKLTERQFRMIATIDVDSAFAYKYKGFRRFFGGIGRDFSGGNWRNLVRRIRTVAGLDDDPFLTYDYITSKADSSNIELIFFFLLADFSKYDINVSHRSKHLQTLIQELSKKYRIGIHPGMASHSDAKIVMKEKRRLEQITGSECAISRQHYLKIKFPETYRRLIDCGIKHDYSMGFADETGFRAGTCRPFRWFDLARDIETDLVIHPVIAMDSTLNTYLGLNPEQAIAHCNELIREVKNVNGEFISIFHNDTLAERGIWKGWRQVWEFINNH